MKIGLLGHGVVGSGVRKIIDAGETWEVRELEVARILVKDQSEVCDPRMTLSADDILDDPDIDVVCECMGGLEPAHRFVKKALENGKHVVTSNKKMLAAFCAELFETARDHHVTIHYEASCGGGIPWMASLDRTRRVDDIVSFRGIFNGTTNYILDRMKAEGKDFGEMLSLAQKLGYAERDPSDDIDGGDVRSKVALSCAKAFDSIVNVEDIPAFGIRHISALDLLLAASMNKTVKLIGSATYRDDCIQACVIPTFMANEEIFSNIPINFNAIESSSKTLGNAMFVGQGAGSLPTAHAVVQNIIDIWKDQDSEINEKHTKKIDNSERYGIFYIRTNRKQAFAELAEREFGDSILITKSISVAELTAAVKNADDAGLFVAEVK